VAADAGGACRGTAADGALRDPSHPAVILYPSLLQMPLRMSLLGRGWQSPQALGEGGQGEATGTGRCHARGAADHQLQLYTGASGFLVVGGHAVLACLCSADTTGY